MDDLALDGIFHLVFIISTPGTATLLTEMLPGVEALLLEKKAVKFICSVIVAVLVLLNFLQQGMFSVS
jgi:hypothetical protein